MSGHNHTFHTPSFGDEDFEVSSVQEHQNFNAGRTTNNQMNSVYDSSAHGYSSANSDENDHPTSVEAEALMKPKKRDTDEPQKPIPAYALFFRDTVSAIKAQNPDVSFTEISKIVASMWDALDPEHKNVYKKKSEIAKKEYIKALTAYKAKQAFRAAEPEAVKNSIMSQTSNITTKQVPVASKPAVFTITRSDSSDQQNQQFTSPVHYMQSPPQHQMTNTVHTSLNQAGPPADLFADPSSVQKCIRDGCTNHAIINPDWEDEYCSNECVVTHCRNVFTQWVQANSVQSAFT